MRCNRSFATGGPDGPRELRAFVGFRAARVVTDADGDVVDLPRPRASGGSRAATASAVLEEAAVEVEQALNADVVDLVARAQAGDARAFGALYDRYVELVHRYVYYRVSSRALTEDLVSETFLRALRRISSFTWQGRDFGAWLVTIARNLIADHYKSSRYKLEVATGEMLDGDRVEDGPECTVLDAMTNVTLLAALKRLGAEQQECLVLRFLNGLSVTETALAMGKTDGAIKALQYRAVQSLRRLLPPELVR